MVADTTRQILSVVFLSACYRNPSVNWVRLRRILRFHAETVFSVRMMEPMLLASQQRRRRMAELEKVLLAYAAAWNEGDEAKRHSLLETSWADDGVYIDPM